MFSSSSPENATVLCGKVLPPLWSFSTRMEISLGVVWLNAPSVCARTHSRHLICPKKKKTLKLTFSIYITFFNIKPIEMNMRMSEFFPNYINVTKIFLNNFLQADDPYFIGFLTSIEATLFLSSFLLPECSSLDGVSRCR